MNKRQIKKRRKKCLPVITEYNNLVLMTGEERQNAYKDYKNFIDRYAGRKRYKDLKGKHLTYFVPKGKTLTDFINELFNISKNQNKNEKNECEWI